MVRLLKTVVSVSGLLIALSTPTQAQPVALDADLLGRAERSAVRVIIGLQQGHAGQPPGDQGAPSTIAAAQAALLAALSNDVEGEVVRFQTIPFVSLYLRRDGLLRAAGLEVVGSISEDVPSRALVSTSATQIGARSLWSAGVSGGGTRIAILDTGMQTSHPYLLNATRDEACFSSNSFTILGSSRSLCPGAVSASIGPGAASVCQSSASDVCQHGTHVAGIARIVSNTSWIIPIQVFSEFNDPLTCSPRSSCVLAWSTDVIRGLDYVSSLAGPTNAARVAAANLSLGGGYYPTQCDLLQPAYKAAIDNLRAKRIATIVSAGNESYLGALGSPACVSSAVSVGSVTKHDVPTYYSNVASFLTLEAPGDDIVSSIPVSAYASFSGTSMAAPHVAGAWGILSNAFPQKSVAEVVAALRATGKVINDAGYLIPRIQVDAAYQHLRNQASQPPGAPTSFSASVNTSSVTLTWFAPQTGGSVTDYVLEAGSGTGLSNLYNASVGAATSLSATVGAGTYFARVRARNAAGTSAPSNEVSFTIGAGCTAPPPAPTGLVASVSGGNVNIQWQAAPGATSYLLQAGSTTGASNLFNSNVGSGTAVTSPVPVGFAAYVRVFAVNACGQSPSSAEVFVQR